MLDDATAAPTDLATTVEPLAPAPRPPRPPRGPACVDLEAERAVLATLLIEGFDDRRTAWLAASSILSAADFYEPRYGAIWQGLAALYERGAEVDVITLCAQLRAVERLNTAGGAQAIERGHHADLRTPCARAIWLARAVLTQMK